MSLDVTLSGERESSEEACPHCGQTYKKFTVEEYYSDNITHNLGNMAGEAGIYEALWRPDEIGITKAHQLIGPLENGIELLSSDRARFEVFNAPNGWGKYENLVSFVTRYYLACLKYPEANVEASR